MRASFNIPLKNLLTIKNYLAFPPFKEKYDAKYNFVLTFCIHSALDFLNKQVQFSKTYQKIDDR